MSKRTVIISGPATTRGLYDGLSKHFDVAVYSKQIAQSLSAERGQPVICPIGGATQALVDDAKNKATVYAAQVVNNLESLPGVNGSMPDYGNWLPGLALNQFGEVIVNLKALDAFSQEVDIAGVVVHEDVTPVFKALTLWAKAQGVPTIHVPHNNCYSQTRPDIHDESISDWILASSPYMRDWYIERGFDSNRIRLVGFGPWDHWADVELSKEHARKVLHLDDRLTVTFCASWAQRTNFIDDHYGLERAMALMMQAAQRQGWQLIWKLHPGDQAQAEQHYQKVAAAHKVDAVVTRGHLAYALAAADVVVSAGPSNVLVEAGLMDRPPALFDLRGYGFKGEPPWSVGNDVDSTIKTVESLAEGATWSKKRAAFVRRYANRNDGKATKRTVRAVRQILQSAP